MVETSSFHILKLKGIFLNFRQKFSFNWTLTLACSL